MSKKKLFMGGFLVLSLVFGLVFSSSSIQDCPSDVDCPGTTSTIPGTVDCNPDWKVVWASDNPQEISRGGHVTLKFEGGNRPYDLTVSGTDFWFDEDHTITTIENNITGTIALYAGSSACVATITVTDNCNVQSSSYVYYSGGDWVHKPEFDNECHLPCPFTYLKADHDYGWHAECVTGEKKQYAYIYEAVTYWMSDGSCDNPPSEYYNCRKEWRGCKNRGWRCIDVEGDDDPGCEDCLSTGLVPCQERSDGKYKCWCQQSLKYYEFQCH